MPGPKPANDSISLQGSGPRADRSSTVLTNTPSHARHFSTGQKINPIWWVGNADDPVPPPDYRPGKSWRKLTWHFRNPGHNFTFYVLGVADKQFTRTGKYPDQISNPKGGWNFALCRYKGLRLPFVDYRSGSFEFYWGWRERGNLGLKLNFAAEKKRSPPQVAELAGEPSPED